MYSNLHFTEHSMEDTIDKVKRIKSPINDKIQQLGEAMDILKQDITILGIRYKLLIFLFVFLSTSLLGASKSYFLLVITHACFVLLFIL